MGNEHRDVIDVLGDLDEGKVHEQLTKQLPSKKKTARNVIVTTQYRDLYYGEISATDEEVNREKAVRVVNCRHIAYWKGPTGGLTSLAVKGPLQGSRIGAPCSALITGVAHVLDVTSEAAARFAAIAP